VFTVATWVAESMSLMVRTHGTDQSPSLQHFLGEKLDLKHFQKGR
jgi:hypothetical protein